jgi:hypothetical protein
MARTLYPREALLAQPQSHSASRSLLSASSSRTSFTSSNSISNSRSNSSAIDEPSRSNSFADPSEAAVTAAAGVTAGPVTALLLGDLRRDDTHAGCWLLRSQVYTMFALCTSV